MKKQMNEITTVREFAPAKPVRRTADVVVENLQLLGLALTIMGQVIIGSSYIAGQGLWLVSNLIAIFRDFYLHRPMADKVKNITLTGITLGLVVVWLLGGFR